MLNHVKTALRVIDVVHCIKNSFWDLRIIGIDLEASKIDLEIQTEHEVSPAHQAQELQITTLANPRKEASL